MAATARDDPFISFYPVFYPDIYPDTTAYHGHTTEYLEQLLHDHMNNGTGYVDGMNTSPGEYHGEYNYNNSYTENDYNYPPATVGTTISLTAMPPTEGL